VIARRTPAGNPFAPSGIPESGSQEPHLGSPALEPPLPSSVNMLAVIKEELFQLEVERQQGRIADEEYTNAKAALDLTLKRALARPAKG
jgi:hypothetical protein